MRILTLNKNTKYGKLKDEKNVPAAVSFNLFQNNEIEYTGGTKEAGICLNCIIHPCMNYSSDETSLEILPGMPHTNAARVCPSNAIALDSDGFPSIDPTACFGCGLCLTRCNYAAIHLGENSIAEINKGDSTLIKWVSNITTEEQHLRDNIYSRAKITVEKFHLSKPYLTQLYEKILANIRTIGGFDILFVRNLFLNLGVKNKVRAIGNNDIRFDLIGKIDNHVVVGEIGLNGIDILEGPRAILDDIAALNSRYSIRPDTILPLIITMTFPNKRSDVYEVIHDIEKITGIKIFSVSVHILIILSLLRKKIDSINILQSFYIDNENRSLLKSCLEIIPELKEIDPFFGLEYYQAVK